MRYASVCDGIGAAHVAWQPLGWQCQWTSEIEPFPVAVVEHHYGFRNLGDMTKITEDMIDASVDLLVGGTPCQSFSVAGLRGGLADPRGNLALRFVQLASVMQPKWIVWENVPGVLSSGKGRDFGTFLGALGELGYGFAYRVLDAQWFGVAQRRRRVFVVGYLGDWRRAAAVLFERESVFGNPPTRGAAGEGVATATPISTRTGRSDDRGDGCDNLVAFHPTQDPISSEDGLTHAIGTGSSGGCATAAVAFTKSKRAQSVTDDETWVPGEVSPTMSCFDQGDTRATTVVAFATDLYNGAIDGDVAHSIRVGNGNAMGGVPSAMAFKPSHYTRGKDGAPSEVAAPLSADADKGDQDTVVAFAQNQLGEVRTKRHVMGTVNTNQNASGRNTPMVAVSLDGGNQSTSEEIHHTLRIGRDSGDAVHTPMAVRRLTPRECERLQGFPDDYTLVSYRGKPACDGPRYRALGNSMAVPVMRWIGERIAMVTAQAARP